MKRILALLLAVCMLLPLVACGETTTTTEPTEQTEPAEGGDELELTGDVVIDTMNGIRRATAIEPGEEYDFESHLPLVKEGEDNHLTIGLVTSAMTTDYNDNEFTKWVEEQTGVELEFMQFTGSSSDAATQLSLMMAAGETLPDILLRFTGVSKAQGADFGEDGYFADLSEYFQDPEMNYYRKWAIEGRRSCFSDDAFDNLQLRQIDPETGAMYAYPRMENSPEDRPRFHVSINKAWLEKVGMDIPTDTESLRAVLEAFRDQDPNGNGQKDELPMVGRNGTTFTDIIGYLINAFVYYHPSYHFNITDGKLWTPYVTDEYRQALTFINDLYNDGLIAEQVWTMDNTELKALQNPTDGVYKAGIITANRYSTIDAAGHAMQDYEEVPPLADETGKGGYGPVDYYSMEYNTFISADSANPELAFKLLDFLCCDEAQVRSRWGVYQQDWDFSDGSGVGNLGGESFYKMLTDDPQTYANNLTWHNYSGIQTSLYRQKEIDVSDPDAFTTARYYRDLACIENYEKAGLPDECYYFSVFTKDESDEREEFVSDITQYVKKARDEFSTGIRDVRSDSDWQKYLDDLAGLGYDRWVEMTQTAYDRTFSK